MRKDLLLLLAAAILWGVAYFKNPAFFNQLLMKEGGGEAAAPSSAPMAPMMAMPVTAAKALRVQAEEWHSFSGRLEAVEEVQIVPRVNGPIESIHFKDGAIVAQGSLLFMIDPRPFDAAVKQAAAAVSSAAAVARFAKTEFDRAQKLIKQKAIADRDFETAKNTHETARSALHAAEARLATAELDLGYTRITAPISGRMGRAEVTVGNIVQGGAGNPSPTVLSTIVSDNPIYAAFDMDEQSYIKFMGMTAGKEPSAIPVKLKLMLETEKEFTGKIHSFDNKLDPASGTVRVRAIFDNPEGLLIPGLFAEVKVGEPLLKERIVISDRAVATDQDRKFVYVINKDNAAEYRPIKLGGVINGLREIKSGLEEDELIVVKGLQRVQPGAALQPEIVPMDQANKDG